MSTIKVGLRYIDIWKTSLEKEVQAYEAEPIQKGGIVFYGPSDFTRWGEKYGNPNLADEVRGASGAKCCINRGFGSSCPEHMLYYYPRMVRPLEPKVLVLSSAACGNGGAFGYTAEEMLYQYERIIAYASVDFPDMKIYVYGENKDRHAGSERRLACINGLEKIASEIPNCTFIDGTTCPDLVRDDLFIEDRVHYNPEGYRIFADFFKNALKDELAEL